MEAIRDVHTEHCCIVHGCKYCDDECTVESGRARQSYLCESCYASVLDFEETEAEYLRVMELKKLMEYVRNGSPHA